MKRHLYTFTYGYRYTLLILYSFIQSVAPSQSEALRRVKEDAGQARAQSVPETIHLRPRWVKSPA